MRNAVSAVLVASLLVANLAVAAEVQVPLDRAGRVQRVDAALAKRIGMFSDRPGFQEARLFQLADSSFVLEISSMLEAGLSRERVPLTSAGVDSIRDLVTTGLAEHHTTPTIDTSGRPLFVTTTTLMCFGFYGWAIPYLFEENASSEVVSGTYLVTAGLGTFLPLYLTRDGPVSMGSALMSWYGMSRGTLHGALLPYALSDDPAEKSPVGTAFAFSIAEGIGGYVWAARTKMSEGSAATISNGADYGALYGLGFADLLDADKTGNAAGPLIGSGVGLIAAALYAPHRDHTYGDASVMRTGGWVGAYTGIAIAQTFSNVSEWDESTTIGAMTGGALGLAVGDGLVRKVDFTFGQGVIVDLCAIGGGLFGLGLGTFASGNDAIKEEVLWSTSAVGTIAGYALGYRMNAKAARRAAADRSAWRFDVMPTPPARGGGMPGLMLTVGTTMR